MESIYNIEERKRRQIDGECVLRLLIRNVGCSVAEIADELDVAPMTVRRWRGGEVVASAATLAQLWAMLWSRVHQSLVTAWDLLVGQDLPGFLQVHGRAYCADVVRALARKVEEELAKDVEEMPGGHEKN